MASEISLEQTNRIRKALGLVLIPTEDEEPAIQGILDDTIEQQLEQLQKLRHVEAVEPVKTLIEEPSTAQSFLKRMKQLQAKTQSEYPVEPKLSPNVSEPQTPATNTPPAALTTAEPVQEPAQPKLARPKTHVKPVEDSLDRVEIFEPKYAKADYTQAPKFKVRNSKSKKRKLEQQVDVPALSVADFKLEQGPALHIEVPQRPSREETLVQKFESGEKKASFQVRDSASLLKKLSEKRERGEPEGELKAGHEGEARAESGSSTGVFEVTGVTGVTPEATPATQVTPGATGGSGLAGVSSMLQRLRANGTLEERESTRNPQWIKSVAAERAKRAADLAQRRPMSAEAKAEDDYYNKREELELAKRQFKDYEPVVNLQYFDKKGEKVSAKQAWKDLSHKFHGTGEHKK